MIRRDLETYRYPIVNLIFFVVIVFIVTSVSAETETASYWVSASNSFGSMGKWNETLDAAEKAIAIDPNNKFAWCNKAWALTHLRRYNDALAAAEKATVIDPNYYLAWTNMADALGNLKRYQEELDAANKAISLNPLYSGGWIDKGQALCNLGSCQDALIATEEAIKLNPSHPVAWNNKASILNNLKRYQEALDPADKALSLDPSYVKAWANKGDALKNLGRYQEALAAYEKALLLEPTYEPAKNNEQFIISNNLATSTNNSGSPPPVNLSSPLSHTEAVPPSGVQDNQALFLPLVFVIIIIVISLSAIGYSRYNQRPVKFTSPSIAKEPVIPSKNSHHDVFISYAQNDKITADATCAKLESQNIRCWISPRDVPPGESFPRAIVEGIEESKIMVVIFSSYSNNSQHVIREITTAVNKGLIIIPFRIEDVLPSKDMEYLISTPHWMDAITPPLENHLTRLSRIIEKILSSDKPEPG